MCKVLKGWLDVLGLGVGSGIRFTCHTSSYVREACEEPCLREMQFAALRVQAALKLGLLETA